MKKIFAIILSLTLVLTLIGCNNRSMNYIIENEPSLVGIVEEVYDNSIIIYVENDGYPNGADCEVSLDVENTDSFTGCSVWVMKRSLCTTMVKSQKAIRYRSIRYMLSH